MMTEVPTKLLGCCDDPHLSMDWRIGVNEAETGMVIEFANLSCSRCGRGFLFDGLIATGNDGKNLLLEISKEPRVM